MIIHMRKMPKGYQVTSYNCNAQCSYSYTTTKVMATKQLPLYFILTNFNINAYQLPSYQITMLQLQL